MTTTCVLFTTASEIWVPSPFTITAATNTMRLDDQRPAETELTVVNDCGHAVGGWTHFIAQNPAAQG